MRSRLQSRYELTAELRRQGFESPTITASFSGGKCGLCHKKVVADGRSQVVKFRGRGWCHVSCTTAVCSAEYSLQHATARVDVGGDDSYIQRRTIEYENANLAKFGLTYDPQTGRAK